MIGKLERSLDNCKNDKEYLRNRLSTMKKKIYQEPAKGRKVVDDIRAKVVSHIEDDGFWSDEVQKLLRELRITKDAYDITLLGLVDKENVYDLVSRYLW